MELKAEGVRKTYFRQTGQANYFEAVAPVDLTLEGGKVHVLMGRSGSGKTTLLHMLGGLLRPTEGRVTLDGTDLYALEDGELSRLRNARISVIPQGRSAVETLTVKENILLPGALYGRSGGDAEAAADKYGAYFQEDLQLGFSELDLSRPLETNVRLAWEDVPAGDRTRESIQLGNALLTNCQQHGNNLLKYHLEQNLTFDEQDGETSGLRTRYCVTLRWKEARLSLFDFIKELQKSINTTETVFTDSDRELFENILTQTVSQQLRARIERACFG